MKITNDFAYSVELRLLELRKDRAWLVEEIRKRGKYCSKQYLSKIMVGDRKATRIKILICEILDMPYEREV